MQSGPLVLRGANWDRLGAHTSSLSCLLAVPSLLSATKSIRFPRGVEKSVTAIPREERAQRRRRRSNAVPSFYIGRFQTLKLQRE